jgi:hypothetical protein
MIRRALTVATAALALWIVTAASAEANSTNDAQVNQANKIDVGVLGTNVGLV